MIQKYIERFEKTRSWQCFNICDYRDISCVLNDVIEDTDWPKTHDINCRVVKAIMELTELAGNSRDAWSAVLRAAAPRIDVRL